MKLRMKIGFVLAGLNLLILLQSIWEVYGSNDAQAGMGYILILLYDFFLIPLLWIVPRGRWTIEIVCGIFGTLAWFLIPIVIAGFFRTLTKRLSD